MSSQEDEKTERKSAGLPSDFVSSFYCKLFENEVNLHLAAVNFACRSIVTVI